MPDEMKLRIEGLLPKSRKSKKGGRPRLDWRPVLDGIFYVLRTGCQWKALPPEFGSDSSVHRCFQLLVKRNLFRDLWMVALEEYDDLKGLNRKWQSMDGAMTKAPLGGEKPGANPTDRAKSGTKRSLLTEGHCLPIRPPASPQSCSGLGFGACNATNRQPPGDLQPTLHWQPRS